MAQRTKVQDQGSTKPKFLQKPDANVLILCQHSSGGGAGSGAGGAQLPSALGSGWQEQGAVTDLQEVLTVLQVQTINSNPMRFLSSHTRQGMNYWAHSCLVSY